MNRFFALHFGLVSHVSSVRHCETTAGDRLFSISNRQTIFSYTLFAIINANNNYCSHFRADDMWEHTFQAPITPVDSVWHLWDSESHPLWSSPASQALTSSANRCQCLKVNYISVKNLSTISLHILYLALNLIKNIDSNDSSDEHFSSSLICIQIIE